MHVSIGITEKAEALTINESSAMTCGHFFMSLAFHEMSFGPYNLFFECRDRLPEGGKAIALLIMSSLDVGGPMQSMERLSREAKERETGLRPMNQLECGE